MKKVFNASYLLLFVLCLMSVVTRAQSLYLADEPHPKREARAVWLTTLKSLDWPTTKATDEASRNRQKQELTSILDRLKAAGINQVLLQTRVRGAGIYPSKIEPWYYSLTGKYDKSPGYDPLAFAIEECHRRGMELHAWVVTIPTFDVSEAKKVGPKSLLNTHPSYLRKHEDKYYLDPGIPAVSDYLCNICTEIVSNYDIDGIHFDYIRYPENNASFPDGETYKKYGQGQKKADWRRANISRIVRNMYYTIKALKPWVKVSSSPIGKFDNLSRYPSRGWDAYNVVYQDAQGWLREGIHDALYPMMYFKGDNFYPFAADWQEHANGRMIVVGLGTYFLDNNEGKWPLVDIQREIYHVRRLGMAGECHFRSLFFTNNTKGIYDYTKDVLNAYPSLVPAMTWIDSIPPTTPHTFTSTPVAGGMLRLDWAPSTDDVSGTSVRYNVYASRTWPVDITRAENLVATALPRPTYTYNVREKVLRGMYLAVTAMDRCGNESAPVMLDADPAIKTTTQLIDNDGRRLTLKGVEGSICIIRDLTGRSVTTCFMADNIDISRLRPGFYSAYTMNKKGVEHLIGWFRK